MEENYLENITKQSEDYLYEEFNKWLGKNGIIQEADPLKGLIEYKKQYSKEKTISVTYRAEKLYMIEGFETNFFDELRSELSQVFLIESAKQNLSNDYGYEFLINEYCEGCSDYDPHVHRFYENGNTILTRVVCEHERRCKKIYNLIKEKFEENKKSNDQRRFDI